MATIAELFDEALRCHQIGNLSQAASLYRQILHFDPAHADALHLLGVLTFQTGDHETGLALIRQAIVLNPSAAVFHNNLGVYLKELGRLTEAVASYHEALKLNPRYVDALSNLGIALRDLGRHAEAAEACRQALRLNPRHAEAQGNLGLILKDQGQLEAAVECYQEALRLKPQFVDALNNLGIALGDQGNYAEAAEYHRQVLHINPHHADAHANLGLALKALGQWAEAEAYLDGALRLKPDHVNARWNLSALRLLQGDFSKAWPDYESRWVVPGFSARHDDRPRWDGAPLHGETILLYAEQGLGDTLQFIRYAPMVKERGGMVLFECQPALMSLLEGVAGVDQLLAIGAALPPYDVQVPLLSLPGIFGTSVATIPATVPYVRAAPALVKTWRTELEALGGFKIGVAWQGNPNHQGDRYRSFPLEWFEDLARVERARLVSLQKGPGTEQLLSLGGRFPILDVNDRLDAAGAFLDTAAIMMNLDLVITVDSAVAHLAGALGVPVWVVLPFDPDWRWLLERADSPWYPTMRLFRQKCTGDWREVFEQIATEVSARLLCHNARSNPGHP
ncbi:MAG TPA: tetratricopeptide repeat-containing glycosyltransferase family protein [Gemmataceae bacterium]|jgi:tetratricopeptide (TPR) repeat protein|nr:tetratricopeptide repeat-containing glycosyltransferase family protein [Gemmataceae bacterium]